MKKINSIHFGGKMLATGAALCVAVPAAVYFITGRFVWQSLIPGAAVLLALAVILAVEKIQDISKTPYYEKGLKQSVPYDSEKQVPVIRSSICTGEKTAGFKDKKTGRFTEVMVVKSEEDKKRFMEIYGLDSVNTEY